MSISKSIVNENWTWATCNTHHRSLCSKWGERRRPDERGARPSNMQPDYLGPYKIIATLGHGGMGTVYHASHSKTGEQVAVKIIAEAIAKHERFRRRFDAEVETLKRLKHKHIVKLIGYGEEAGRLFYSMEYVAGESLHQRIKRTKVLSWQLTVQFAIEICSALKHAHDFGVIHRDIKPANILIDENESIKMTDFGIAKLYGSAEETVLGSILGTADYMPPEQAEGSRVTVRSDLYSLGAMMYCCLCGRSPHAAKTMPEVLYNVRYKDPQALNEFVPDVPAELDFLILDLLKKDPKERPPTALVVWNRLSSMQIGLNRRSSAALDEKNSGVGAEFEDSLELSDISTPDDLDSQTSAQTDRISAGDAATRMLDLTQRTFEPKKSAAPQPTMASDAFLSAAHCKKNQGHTTDIVTHLSDFESLPQSSAVVEDVSPASRSSFTALGDDSPERRKWAFDQAQPETNWPTYLSIGFLLLAICGCVAAIFYSTRAPSANSLYRQTLVASENPNGSIGDIETTLQTFEANYPDDPRLGEFEDVRREIALQTRVNSLVRQLHREGERSLEPLELAFAEAMTLRDEDPSLAVQRLGELAIVFQNADLLSPGDHQLLKLAAQERQRLLASANSLDSPTELYLSRQIEAATKLTVQQQKQFYQALINLYDDKGQAKLAVARAKLLLAELE